MTRYRTIQQLSAAGAACGFFAVSGCQHTTRPAATAVQPAAATATAVTFTDVTRAAGLRFVHNGGDSGRKWLPETMGAGAVFFDYDGDGWPDLYLVNGRDWTPEELRRGKVPGGRQLGPSMGRLYHNNHGTFEDVTHQAGLDVVMYGMGCAAGDYDNDGHIDLYVTGLGRNYLFHNNGNGTFTEVAERAGVKDSGWSTSCAWVDTNNDGKLDLFVCHYVKWSPETDLYCSVDGKHKSYCTPFSFTGEPNRLFRNDGHGHFTDVSDAAGIRKTPDGRLLQGKSLGVALCDYDNDGRIDLAVSNDTEPNYLFHNNGDDTFTEVGTTAGVAFSEAGQARGAMGIDAADFDGSGRDSLLIGNFSNEMLALYHNQGQGLFIDVAPRSQVGPSSLLSLAFGCFFFDYDNDGWPDIFVANGHVEDDINSVQRDVTHAQRPLLFHNEGQGAYVDAGLKSGPALSRPLVGRGAIHADYDLDGNEDVLICTNRGPAVLLRNEGNPSNHALRLKLEGTRSNRSAIGALVLATVGHRTERLRVRSGSSYCSQSDLALTVGLGRASAADRLEIRWPSGEVTRLTNVPAGQALTIREGTGIVARMPLPGIPSRVSHGFHPPAASPRS